MTTEDLPGRSAPETAHPAGVVPQPPPVRDQELAGLRQPDFPIAIRGYEREAVDAYVRHVNQVIADLQVGRSPQAAIRHALDQVSEETRGILERAHETAEEITSRSQAQAAERIDQAEHEAREITRRADTRARMLDQDADEIWSERKRLVDDVQRVAEELAELADAAARRFPPEGDDDTDTVPIEEPAARSEQDEPVPPPPPPPAAGEEDAPATDGRP